MSNALDRSLQQAIGQASEAVRKYRDRECTAHGSWLDHAEGRLDGLRIAADLVAKHGPKSTELAEGDLLGEALELIQDNTDENYCSCDDWMNTPESGNCWQCRARALLSRLPEPPKAKE